MDHSTTNIPHHDEDAPPFAIEELCSPQHLFLNSTASITKSTKRTSYMGDTYVSSSSSAPGLVESMLTDESSSPSGCSSDILSKRAPHYLDSKSSSSILSINTVASGNGGLPYLSSSRVLGLQDIELSKSNVTEGGSAGFTQLLHAADDANVNVGRSKMPMVPEHEMLESSHEYLPSGTLILAPEETKPTKVETTWFHTIFPNQPNQQTEGLREPLLPTFPNGIEVPLLSNSPSEAAICRAKSAVKSLFEDDKSFEVSMELGHPCTVEDVMSVIGNPALLKMWYDPIQTLVVTSSSDASRTSFDQPEMNQEREYEGEWIEATTTALESPPSNIGYIYTAGQAVLEIIGFASYGKITMFVERQRGQVSLTVGPFSGGMHAAHTISVFEEGGKIRVVDRVRLSKEEESLSLGSMLLCGIFDSCFSSCLLPTLGGYLDQVTTSMARLRILVESGELSQEAHIFNEIR